MINEYLQEKELLDKSKHVHMLSLFSGAWLSSDFEWVIKCFSLENFGGYQEIELQKLDNGYSVMCDVCHKYDGFVSFKDLGYYLEIVSKRYIEENPDQEEIITKYLNDYKERYNLK